MHGSDWWLIIMGLVQSIGVILIMVSYGVDMANPESAEALFSEMSFDSPVMLILTAYPSILYFVFSQQTLSCTVRLFVLSL